MSRFIAMAVASTLFVQGSAIACGVEGSRIAGEARQRLHLSLRRVTGTFTVVSRESRASDEAGEKLEVTTYYGRVTRNDGRTFNTIHVDDGLIMLCATTYTPTYNAEGTFYLARKPDANGRYRLRDFEGDPIGDSEATKN